MPYIIENSSGDPIVIPDGSLNTDYSIDLVGRNYENYGQIIAKTQIDLLDNFATDSTPPTSPTSGQLWYDKTNKQLRVYDATTGAWLTTRPLVSATIPANSYGQNKSGTMYYNTDTGQMYVNIGGLGYREVSIPGEISSNYGPTFYGTSLRNIFLTDTDNEQRAVLALYYRNTDVVTAQGFYQGEKIVAIISGHDQFEVADALSSTGTEQFNFYEQFNFGTQPGGMGPIIRPGINTRVDDDTLVNSARKAIRTDEAYALNTGTYTLATDGSIDDGVSAITISAIDVFNANANAIPNVTNTYSLGNLGNVFSEGYITDLYVGNGTAGKIESTAFGTLDIGSSLKPVTNLHASTSSVYSGLKFPNNSDVGEISVRAGTIYATSIDTSTGLTVNNYSLPFGKGNNGDQMFIGANGDSVWSEPINDIASITSSGGSITITPTSIVRSPGGTVSINVRNLDLSVDTASVRAMISIDSASADDLSYDDSTGKIKYIRETPFDNLVPETHFILRQGGLAQTADGVKTFTSRADFPAGMDVGKNIRYGVSADYPVGINSPSTNLVFDTRDDATGTDHSITFSKSGDITATGDVTAFSDERLKENIDPIADAMDKVKQISGYTFNRKGDPRKHAGVIAQEVQKVLPEVVTEDDDGMLSVAYGNMVGLLIEAIKDLSAEVDELKKKLGE